MEAIATGLSIKRKFSEICITALRWKSAMPKTDPHNGKRTHPAPVLAASVLLSVLAGCTVGPKIISLRHSRLHRRRSIKRLRHRRLRPRQRPPVPLRPPRR